MTGSTYEIEAPKQCQFCGEQMPTKHTAYDNHNVDFKAALTHFAENPQCAAQMAGRTPISVHATAEGERV